MLPDIVKIIKDDEDILSRITDVKVEDLLGREPIVLEEEAYNSINNKVVMVTGGGGSIGSELCRQIANFKPEKLIIVDIYENSAYSIQQELKRKYGNKLNLDVRIASVRDTKKIDEYAKRSKEQWGQTDAYKEFEHKSQGRTESEEMNIAQDFMNLFSEMGTMKNLDPASEQVQLHVKKIQDYITAHFYTCTKEIFRSLGEMYGCGGEFTENIDKVGGVGTAEFASKAIKIYCQ